MPRKLGAIAALCILAAVAAHAAEGETPLQFASRGDGGIELQGLLGVPPVAPTPVPAVVICHPDPRYGGNMNSSVVVTVQQACSRLGWATLRFNFRGVDRSGGAFDGGDGEVLDCLGALDRLRAAPGVDPERVAIVGYSFGAWVGLRAAVTDGDVPACVCVAFPVPAEEDIAGHEYFARIGRPVLFITGTADSISSLGTVRAIIAANGRSDCCRVVALEGADHFYGNPAHLRAAATATTEFLRQALTPRP